MIEELVVRKNHQNEGVGRILISTLIEIAINLKCAEISVTTLINNEGAIKFYKLQGLTEEGLLLEKHLLTDI
jgi:ribosomal protein S18 acetylase RimI-like enzyme